MRNRRINIFFVFSFSIVFAVFSGCYAVPESDSGGVSTTEVAKVLSVIGDARDKVEEANDNDETVPGIKATFDSATGGSTYVFSGYVDKTSGYTVNGTHTLSFSGTVPIITETFGGTLALSGGAIKSFSFNFSFSYNMMTKETSYAGTVTADGERFKVAELVTQAPK